MSCNSFTSDCFLSDVILASMGMVSIGIPRNVRQVVGPSTLDCLIGALILLQNVSMLRRYVEHMFESAGPAVGKLSR